MREESEEMLVRKPNTLLLVASLAALVLVLALPVVGYAAEYDRLGNMTSVDDAPGQKLNTVKVTAGSGELKSGDVVIMSLPQDFSFNASEEDWSFGSLEDGAVYYGDYDNGCYIYVPWDNENGLNLTAEGDTPVPTDILSVVSLDDNEIKIAVKDVEGYPSIVEDSYFFIYLKNVDVAKGWQGAIEFAFHAPGGSGFGGGELDGGRVGRIIADPEPVDEPDTPAPNPEDEEDTGTQGVTVFTLGKSTFMINGKSQVMDVAPYVKEGRTYLPVRFVAGALGIPDSDIQWSNGTVTFKPEGMAVSMSIGSKVMYVNGNRVIIDAAPEILNGRTMLPIKWISEAFGVSVVWNSETSTVTLQ